VSSADHQRHVRTEQERVTELVTVAAPMMLVMPSGANPNLSVAADRKPFTLKAKNWNWIYTPTIVK
jgi:hypothetical protein